MFPLCFSFIYFRQCVSNISTKKKKKKKIAGERRKGNQLIYPHTWQQIYEWHFLWTCLCVCVCSLTRTTKMFLSLIRASSRTKNTIYFKLMNWSPVKVDYGNNSILLVLSRPVWGSALSKVFTHSPTLFSIKYRSWSMTRYFVKISGHVTKHREKWIHAFPKQKLGQALLIIVSKLVTKTPSQQLQAN